MLIEKDILDTLNDSINHGYYSSFIDLGHPYSYLIDRRLNIFSDNNKRWAIAAEVLGYNPRSGGILLEIKYFGNCLLNLNQENRQDINSYFTTPMDWDSFVETIDGEDLKADANYWIVRGKQVALSHNKQDYINAGITLKEYEPNKISVEEAGRLVVPEHRELFRATDEELYKSIPPELKKILVIDQWHHKDYMRLYTQHISEEKINITYQLGKQMAGKEDYMDYETFLAKYKQSEQQKYDDSLKEYLATQPSSYETWQQIAKVIATGDPSHYKPSLEPNTHWKYWPESGTM